MHFLSINSFNLYFLHKFFNFISKLDSCLFCVKSIKFIASPIKLHCLLISMAVSFLSPVNTHILIPQSINVFIVSGTPSCNLSSMAEQPQKIKSFSISE